MKNNQQSSGVNIRAFLVDLKVYIYSKIVNKYFFFASLLLFLLCLIFSCLHYSKIYEGNNLSWITWILSMFTFIVSFIFPEKKVKGFLLSFKAYFHSIKKTSVYVGLFVIILYWTSHLFNFSIAPWNKNGLFDDAAWDIFFAKNHVFNGTPFQAAFFDNVGLISREVIFHYYISVFFKLFGYNLLVFNVSLLFLGFITVFFTTFLVHKMFGNVIVTIITAILINFLPFHFMHIFMGHRYAISAPLMMLSLYYLYTSFKYNSFYRTALGGIFAALCVDSAVMGKQYIYALIATTIFLLITGIRTFFRKENISLGIIFILSFVIAATPLLVYIGFHTQEYFIRESSLTKEFFEKYQNGGYEGIKPYVEYMNEVFIKDFSYRRQFVPGFPVIPLPYFLLIIPGLFISLFKKRFEIIFISIIPVAGSFIAGCYDFRVLISAPVWIIAMSAFLYYCFGDLSKETDQNKNVPLDKSHKSLKIQSDYSGRFIQGTGYYLAAVSVVIILCGLIPAISYINKVSKDTNYLYLLPHKDVAVSRVVQDIVLGEAEPSVEMKPDELNRKSDLSLVPYDTLVSPQGAYAIMHLFLQNYDDTKILAFNKQTIQAILSPDDVLENNIEAIENYTTANKDLKLVWEISDKSQKAIRFFSKYKEYGKDETITRSCDGISFSLYTLTIKNQNIEKLKNDLQLLN